MPSQYKDLAGDLGAYFRRYGGLRALLLSPYTHFAIIGSTLSAGSWLKTDWPSEPLQVLPNLLGFALAAYALLLGFGDDEFRKFLATSDSPNSDRDENSLLTDLSSTFLHFVIVQIVAIALAIVGNSHPLALLLSVVPLLDEPHLFFFLALARNIFAFVAFTAFTLSITTSCAAALGIFHATRWYVQFRSTIEK